MHIKGKLFFHATAFFFFYCYMSFVIAFEVTSYYGKYDPKDKEPGRPSNTLFGPVLENWELLKKVKKDYKIGVLLPHVEDAYWLAINYGIIEEAKKLGITVKILSAGGYQAGQKQWHQLTDEIMAHDVDGIIISPIYYERYDKYIEEISNLDIPIVALVNDVSALNISAKVMASYYDVGYEIGKFILRDAKGKNIKIAFFPGPKQSIWAPLTFQGFTQSLRDNPDKQKIGKVTIVAEQYGDLSLNMQYKLIDFVLNAKKNIDYVVGNAIAASVAPKALSKYKERHRRTKIISTYVLPDLYENIKSRKIYASAHDNMIIQAKLALSIILKNLEKQNKLKNAVDENKVKKEVLPFILAPKIEVLSYNNIQDYPYSKLFAPNDFKPVLEYTPSFYRNLFKGKNKNLKKEKNSYIFLKYKKEKE